MLHTNASVQLKKDVVVLERILADELADTIVIVTNDHWHKNLYL